MPLRRGCGRGQAEHHRHAHRMDTSCPCKGMPCMGASMPRKGEDEREGADQR